ncbi:MAG: hypothetical protein KDA42_07820 [Planctomycetales bacterium]|nr:hypothetical protein [Planctomycetales bacterium]
MRAVCLKKVRLLGVLLTSAAFATAGGCKKEEPKGFDFPTAAPKTLDPFAEELPESIEIEESDDAPPERGLPVEEAGDEPAGAGGSDTGAADLGEAESSTVGDAPQTTTLELSIKMSPLAIVDQQFEFLQAERLNDAARNSWIPEDAESRKKLASRLKALSDAAAAEEMTFEAVDQHISGTWAVVPMRVDALREGKPVQGLVDQYLVQTDSGWKIAPKYLHTDPQLQSLMNADFQAVSTWYQQHEAALKKEFLD